MRRGEAGGIAGRVLAAETGRAVAEAVPPGRHPVTEAVGTGVGAPARPAGRATPARELHGEVGTGRARKAGRVPPGRPAASARPAPAGQVTAGRPHRRRPVRALPAALEEVIGVLEQDGGTVERAPPAIGA